MDLTGGFPSVLNTLKGKTILEHDVDFIHKTEANMWVPLPMWQLWAKALPTSALPSVTQHLKPHSYQVQGEDGRATILPPHSIL